MSYVVPIVLSLAAPLIPIGCVIFFRPFLKKDWVSYLGWEAVPLLQFLLAFVLMVGVNWPYESKLLTLRNSGNFADAHLGPILLASGLGFALLASLLLLLLRWLLRRIFSPIGKWYLWIPIAFVGYVISVNIVNGTLIVVLGPAAITMYDERTAARAGY